MNERTLRDIIWIMFFIIEFAIHIFAIQGILAWADYMGW